MLRGFAPLRFRKSVTAAWPFQVLPTHVYTTAAQINGENLAGLAAQTQGLW